MLFYLDRLEGLAQPAKLKRTASEYFRDNLSVTSSGIWSHRYLQWAIEVLGVDRIRFSIDYPYRLAPDKRARKFLLEADLSDEGKTAIAHGNWQCIVGKIR